MKIFDRSKIKIKPLAEREHDITSIKVPVAKSDGRFYDISQKIRIAKESNASIILMIGGHVIRSGVQPYIIDMMKKGYITHIAMNGAVMIHDYELSLIGATTENVSKYIKTGEFGLWKETGELNDIINDGYEHKMGMGECIGQAISSLGLKYNHNSILATAYKLKIPATVHVGIGYDIIHEHPNCNGAAIGATSYKDFLIFTNSVSNLENGVVMNFGSAVMAPEVFLKALSMSRNVAHQNNKTINHFSTLVCDLHDLPNNFHEEPSKDNPAYYFRPWKTMLIRTLSDGGNSYYIKGKHEETIPSLWKALNE